jgi:hypothetical protein
VKGSLPATAAGRRGEVVFSVLGGEVDGVTMVSSSDALPAVGEEMVLFLQSDASAAARAAGSAGAGSAATPLGAGRAGAGGLRRPLGPGRTQDGA